MVFIELYVLCNAVDSHVIQRLRNKFSDRKFEKKKTLSSHDVTTIQQCIDSFRRQRQNLSSNIVIETGSVVHSEKEVKALASGNGIDNEVSVAAIAEDNCAVPDNEESISTIDEMSLTTNKELVLNHTKDAVPQTIDEDDFSLSVIYDDIEVTIFFDGAQVPDLKKVEVNDYRPKGKHQATIKDDDRRLVSNEQSNSDIFTETTIVQSNLTITQTDVVKDSSSVDVIETSITKERLTVNVVEIDSIVAEDSNVSTEEKISVSEDFDDEFHDVVEDVTCLQPMDVKEMVDVETDLKLDEVPDDIIATNANVNFHINSEGIDIIADAIEAEQDDSEEKPEEPELSIIVDDENVEESSDDYLATHVIADVAALVQIQDPSVEENIIFKNDVQVEENVVAVEIDVVEVSIDTNLDTEVICDGADKVEIPDASVEVNDIEIVSEPELEVEKNVVAVEIDVVEASIDTNLDTKAICDGADEVEIPDESVEVNDIEIVSEPELEVEKNVIAVEIDVVEASIDTNLDTEAICDGADKVEIPDESIEVDVDTNDMTPDILDDEVLPVYGMYTKMIELEGEEDESNAAVGIENLPIENSFDISSDVVINDAASIDASPDAVEDDHSVVVSNDDPPDVSTDDADVITVDNQDTLNSADIESVSQPELEVKENDIAVEIDIVEASIDTNLDTEVICDGADKVEIPDASVEVNDIEIVSEIDMQVEENVIALEVDALKASIGTKVDTKDISVQDDNVEIEEPSVEENKTVEMLKKILSEENAITVDADTIKFEDQSVEIEFEPLVEDIFSSDDEEIFAELVDDQELVYDDLFSSSDEEEIQELEVNLREMTVIIEETSAEDVASDRFTDGNKMDNASAVKDEKDDIKIRIDTIDSFVADVSSGGEDEIVPEIVEEQEFALDYFKSNSDEEIEDAQVETTIKEVEEDIRKDLQTKENEIEHITPPQMNREYPESITEMVYSMYTQMVEVDDEIEEETNNDNSNVEKIDVELNLKTSDLILTADEEIVEKCSVDVVVEKKEDEKTDDVSVSNEVKIDAFIEVETGEPSLEEKVEEEIEILSDNEMKVEGNPIDSNDMTPDILDDEVLPVYGMYTKMIELEGEEEEDESNAAVGIENLPIENSFDISSYVVINDAASIDASPDAVEDDNSVVVFTNDPLDVSTDDADVSAESTPIDSIDMTPDIVDDEVLPVYGMYTKMIELEGEEEDEEDESATDVGIEDVPNNNSSDISSDVVSDVVSIDSSLDHSVVVSNDDPPGVSTDDAVNDIPIDVSIDIADVITVEEQETLHSAEIEVSINGLIADPLVVENDETVQVVTTEAELDIDLSAPTADIFSDEYDSDEVIEKIFEMYTEMDDVTIIEDTSKEEIIDGELNEDEEPDLNEIITTYVDEGMLKEDDPEIEEVSDTDRAEIEVIVTNLDEKEPIAEESVAAVLIDVVAEDKSKIKENEVENDQISAEKDLITPIVVESIAEDDLKSEIPEPPQETIESNADGRINIDEVDVFTTYDVIVCTLKEEYRNDSIEITVTDEIDIDIYESDDSAFGEDALETDESVTVVSLIDEEEQDLSSEESDVTIHNDESERIGTVLGEKDVAEEQELVCNGKVKLTVCLNEDVLVVNIQSVDELSYINKNLEIPCLSYVIEVPSINYILSTGWIPLKAIHEGDSLLKFNISPFSGSNGTIIFKVYGNEEPLENYFYGTFNVNLNPFGDIDNAVVSYTKQIMGLKHEFSEIYV